MTELRTWPPKADIEHVVAEMEKARLFMAQMADVVSPDLRDEFTKRVAADDQTIASLNGVLKEYGDGAQ